MREKRVRGMGLRRFMDEPGGFAAISDRIESQG
jgi:hypothetical protein